MQTSLTIIAMPHNNHCNAIAMPTIHSAKQLNAHCKTIAIELQSYSIHVCKLLKIKSKIHLYNTILYYF